MTGCGTVFQTTLYAYLDGELTLEQALRLAQETRQAAEMEIGTAFLDVSAAAWERSDSRAARLLQFAWEFLGPDACLSEFTSARTTGWAIAVDPFLQTQLSENDELFSDEDLRTLAHYWPGLSHTVRPIQAKRISTHANHLLEHPRQLTDDVAQVKRYVSEYNFGQDLNDLLDKVEHGSASASDSFDHAALLKHLRTFFEQLHRQAGETLRRERPGTADGTDLSKCGQAIDYLERKGVLTERMKQLARALYGVLSKEGVHAVKSEREYVRLCRNMIAEYGLILFYELDRRLQEP